MTHRAMTPAISLLMTLSLMTATARAAAAADTGSYEATEASVGKHPLPTWYANAKLGIFIHWGLYSVPGWAPVQGPGNGDFDNGQWMRLNPYAEWYYNTVRIDDSPTHKYDREHFGPNHNYYDFAQTFNSETKKWDPAQWADLFKATGARYVVLTTKHHDGFPLWPTKVANAKLPIPHPDRDLVGDLTSAVRKDGMRMGVYYSGGFDWTFVPGPFRTQKDAAAGTPQGDDYARYVYAHYEELIENYKPDILWNDIRYPAKGKALELFAEFYNKVPEGIINDRWSPTKHSDITTPEYTVLKTIVPKKWEECRGTGQSFGYNRAEGEKETIAPDALVHLLVDIVSKNGNLLLDVGPEADGTIPPVQVDRLKKLGAWLNQNGEAIFDTKPWKRAEGKTAEGGDLRFTSKGDTIYAILMSKPEHGSVTLRNVAAPNGAKVSLLGVSQDLTWRRKGSDLLVQLPSEMPGEYAWALRIQ